MAHIVQHTIGAEIDWYLDDFFFVDGKLAVCNEQVNSFLEICVQINFPVSPEKTLWGSQIMTFLGLLINTLRQLVTIPVEKREKALMSISKVVRSKKIKVLELQKLTGLLNFLCRAIVPGRVFTRRMYAKYHGMKQYHHVRVDPELKMDCTMWEQFLIDPTSVSRPFVDFSKTLSADELFLTSDASLNPRFGYGGFYHRKVNGEFKGSWFSQKWPPGFIKNSNASIEVAEMIGAATAIALWAPELHDRRVIIRCDNQAVMHMINKASSSCKKCMFLLRIITAVSMKHNVRVFCKFIDTKANRLSDLLSRLRTEVFQREAPQGVECNPTPLPTNLWPFHEILFERSE